MAHFAHIENGLVTRVEVLNNDVIATDKGNDSELKGKRFLAGLYPDTIEDDWVQTSYNATIRGAYAGIGYMWDGKTFIAPVEPVIEVKENGA